MPIKPLEAFAIALCSLKIFSSDSSLFLSLPYVYLNMILQYPGQVQWQFLWGNADVVQRLIVVLKM